MYDLQLPYEDIPCTGSWSERVYTYTPLSTQPVNQFKIIGAYNNSCELDIAEIRIYSTPAGVTPCRGTVKFTYDADGNRTERNLIVLKSAKASVEGKKPKALEDSLGNKKILLYPNPTHGEVRVDLDSYDTQSPTTYYLYSIGGKMLSTQKQPGGSFTVDLSNYANGTYILKIQVGNNATQWKIIKQ